MNRRDPDELLNVLDQAQERLGEEFDMRSLLWEILGDVLNSVRLADTTGNGEVFTTVEDYVGNRYGDN